jgi:hypothetical protein
MWARGHDPEPEYTEEEQVVLDTFNEKANLIRDLKDALVWQFRMISTLWEIGKSKGLWENSDVTDATLKQKYASWVTKLNRLEELGE